MKQLEVVVVNMMNKEYFENCHIKKCLSISPNNLKEKALLPFALSVFRVKAIQGIVYYLRTGCGFRIIPKCYGAPTTIYYWFKRMAELGCFEDTWNDLLIQLNEKGRLWCPPKIGQCNLGI